MNPTTPSPEQQPVNSGGPTPEKMIGTGVQEQALRPAAPEQAASVPALAPVQDAGQPAPQPLTAADVAAAIAAMPAPGTPAAVAPTPTVAADQDVVEPEWVDAAEKTIEQTAGNPYAEEEAIEALQIDYLKKRYGYEVKKPEEK